MPIVERSPALTFRAVADYLTALLAQTITQMPLIPVFFQGSTDMSLSFRPAGTSAAAPIHTRYGEMALEISQRCTTFERSDHKHQLQTVSYRYTLGPPGDDHEPLFRWEYIKHPADGGRYSRHHFQGPMPTGLQLGFKPTLFQDVHLPTGWVPIEDVIRFCLHDLEAHAECSPEEWHEILTNSRERFMTDFNEVTDT